MTSPHTWHKTQVCYQRLPTLTCCRTGLLWTTPTVMCGPSLSLRTCQTHSCPRALAPTLSSLFSALPRDLCMGGSHSFFPFPVSKSHFCKEAFPYLAIWGPPLLHPNYHLISFRALITICYWFMHCFIHCFLCIFLSGMEPLFQEWYSKCLTTSVTWH